MIEPDSDDEFIRIERNDDVEYDDEVLESWTWRGDPSGAVYESARHAMRAADAFYGVQIEWWQEEQDYWMGERPEWRDDSDRPRAAKETA
jgi:hypothetical protein